MQKGRVALLGLFTIVCFLWSPATSLGGVSWCAEDPILTFSNGTRLQLVAVYDQAHAPVVAGSVKWSVQVPVNAGVVTATVPPNARHREEITLNYTGGKWGGGKNDLQIHATLTIQASYQFPLMLAVNGDTSTSPMKGSSNKPLTIAAHTHAGTFTAYQGVTTGQTWTFTGTGSATLP